MVPSTDIELSEQLLAALHVSWVHSLPKLCLASCLTTCLPPQGGFLPEMTKREAAQILGMRESAGEDRIREAHLRIMKANHPDLGGSSYIAEKVNEAKDMLLGKRNRTSHF